MTPVAAIDISEIPSDLEYSEEGIFNEEIYVDFTKPTQLVRPFISEKNIDGLVPLNDKEVVEYFLGIPEGRPHEINFQRQNRPLMLRDNASVVSSPCDYCFTDLKESKYYYCVDCYKSMCCLCFEEINEEIALKNGAENYALRKDALDNCRHNHELLSQHFRKNFDCDECDNQIDPKGDILYRNVHDNIDLCGKCASSDLLQKYNIQELKLTAKNTDAFGSMLDWAPYYVDEDGESYILVNCNPESPFYGRIALTTYDDHGRQGYFTLSQNTTMDDLLKELEKYYNENKKRQEKYKEKKQKETTNEKEETSDNDSAISDYCSGWGKFYNSPIKQAMAERKLTIHYG